ncbi:hypothetical protein B0H34DRAFT_428533 [Crassisporium funariophilum]|nr:hypothetical protein B0H34DRAFT_428533 [Crassisporium funariophilum]
MLLPTGCRRLPSTTITTTMAASPGFRIPTRVGRSCSLVLMVLEDTNAEWQWAAAAAASIVAEGQCERAGGTISNVVASSKGSFHYPFPQLTAHSPRPSCVERVIVYDLPSLNAHLPKGCSRFVTNVVEFVVHAMMLYWRHGVERVVGTLTDTFIRFF